MLLILDLIQVFKKEKVLLLLVRFVRIIKSSTKRNSPQSKDMKIQIIKKTIAINRCYQTEFES